MQRKWLPIFLFILGILLGAEGVWEWHRQQWETVDHIKALREEIEAHIMNMAELYRKHATLVTAARALSTDPPGARNISAEIQRLWTQEFPVIKGNIEHCELLLSRLEHRQPKAYHFRPPPPLPSTTLQMAHKKKTIKRPPGGGRKPTGDLQAQKTTPRSPHADPSTTRGNLSRDDTLDRTHIPTE